MAEIVAGGVAKSILPYCVTEPDEQLKQTSEIVLEQPLWMLLHRQDREVLHLETARN